MRCITIKYICHSYNSSSCLYGFSQKILNQFCSEGRWSKSETSDKNWFRGSILLEWHFRNVREPFWKCFWFLSLILLLKRINLVCHFREITKNTCEILFEVWDQVWKWTICKLPVFGQLWIVTKRWDWLDSFFNRTFRNFFLPKSTSTLRNSLSTSNFTRIVFIVVAWVTKTRPKVY